MRRDVLHTRVCELLGVALPIVVAVRWADEADAVAALGALPLWSAGAREGRARSSRKGDEVLPFALDWRGVATAFEGLRSPSPSVVVVDSARGASRAAAAAVTGWQRRGARVVVAVGDRASVERAVSSGADAVLLAPVPGSDLLSLLPEARAAASGLPVLVAGVPHGAGLAAVLCLGASGVCVDAAALAGGEPGSALAEAVRRMADAARQVLTAGVWER